MIIELATAAVGLTTGAAAAYTVTCELIKRGRHPIPRHPHDPNADCTVCGDLHPNLDPETARTVSTLASGTTVGIELAAKHGGLPSAAVLLVPPRAGTAATASVMVLHPDAYADAVNLAADLETIAAGVRAQQGNINSDTHQMRREA